MIFLLIFWYLHLGFLTALVLTTCNIKCGHKDIEDILDIQNGADFLCSMLFWPIILFVGLVVVSFKCIQLTIKCIHWSSRPLMKWLDAWVLSLKGES
jgi:membrane protein required for beta-lactamase induction